MSGIKDLKEAQARTNKLGLMESRIAFLSANDKNAILFPLSECICIAVRVSPKRSYGADVTAHPHMVSTNFGHWRDGHAYWGGAQWYYSRKTGVLFPWNGTDKLPPDARPEGYLHDLIETDRDKSVCLKPDAEEIHHLIINWVNQIFEGNGAMRAGSLFPTVVTPRLMVPVPESANSKNAKNWLILRQGIDLDNCVEAIMNHKAFVIDGIDMESPGNGKIIPSEDGGYIFIDSDGDKQTIADPSSALQDIIFKTFGAAVEVKLHRMFNEETKVAKRQAIFTPMLDHITAPKKKLKIDELKRDPLYQTLQYISVLASATALHEIENEHRQFVDTDLAYTRAEPYVYFFEGYPQVQRIKSDFSAFREQGASYKIDMLDTPLRAAMRRNKLRLLSLIEERTAQGKVRLRPIDGRPNPRSVLLRNKGRWSSNEVGKPVFVDKVSHGMSIKQEIVGHLEEEYEDLPDDLSNDERLILKLLAVTQVYKSRNDLWQRIMEKSDMGEAEFDDVIDGLAKRKLLVVVQKRKVLRVGRPMKKAVAVTA